MATNFPTSLDTLSDVSAGQTIASSTTNNIQDAVEALEAKVGVDSSAVATSLDYLVSNASSSDPGHVHTTAGISGQIAVGKGGTGLSTVAANALLYASSLDTLAALAVGTEGHVLSVSSGVPAWATVADEKVKISANDTTADYLLNKLVAGSAYLTITETGWLDGGVLAANTLKTDSNSLISLSGATLNTTDQGFNVDDGTDFTIGDIILIDSEAMYVSNVVSNSLTVTRAYDGSVAATHADNSAIYILTTKEDITLDVANVLKTDAVNTIAVNSASAALTIQNDGGPDLNLKDSTGAAMFTAEDTKSYSSPAFLFVPDPDVGGFKIKPSKRPTSGSDNNYTMLDIQDGGGVNILKFVAQWAGDSSLQIAGTNIRTDFYGDGITVNNTTSGLMFGGNSCEIRPGSPYSGLSSGAVWHVSQQNNQGGVSFVNQANTSMLILFGNTSGASPHNYEHLYLLAPMVSDDANTLYADKTGQMHTKLVSTATIVYGDATGTKITVPAGSIIRKVYFRVSTTFDGTYAIDIGNGTDADGFLATANITEGTAGLYGINEQDRGALLWDGTNAIGNYSSSAITVVATITAGGATQGAGTIFVEYERVH